MAKIRRLRAVQADNGLSGEQRQAVRARPGPLVVLAGAGSGKTRVLTHRVAHLVRRGSIDPSAVMAITFTNRAAQEMAQRLAALVDASAASAMTIGTFHAVAHRILRANTEQIGRSERFSIYDEADSRRAMAQALRMAGSGLDVREALRAIGLAKSKLMSPRALREADASPYADEVAQAWQDYDALLRRSDALDFDDLIVCAVTLLRADKELHAQLSERFRLVVVDEFQDTSPAQYAFLAELRTQKQNVTVVGDDDQAIYGFRGADPRCVTRFEADFAKATVVKLERNYRSTPQIVGAAGRLVSHNRQRKPKRLASAREPGPQVAVEHHADERSEASACARWCRSLLDGGARPDQIAVLYRTQRHGRAVEQALMGAGIAYRVLGGRGLIDRREVKDALAYLALAANPHDLVAFSRAIGAPRRGIGEVGIGVLSDKARGERSLVGACELAAEIESLNRRQCAAALAFAALMARLSVSQRPSEALVTAVTGSGLTEALRGTDAEGAERLERLRDLVRAARSYEQTAAQPSICEFLAQTRLSSASVQEISQTVALSTVHSAKGLEWECVRVVGLEEGAFPHHRALVSAGAEEERRLGYVAITRAKRRLVLSWSQRRAGRPAARSRFIDEALGE